MGNDLLNQRYKLITGYPAGDDITEEVLDLEAKAKHFDAIIELIKIDNYDETIMHTIFEYCKENDINIQCH